MPSFNFICSLLLLAVLCLNTAEAVLHCWRCSTDVTQGEFCNDPFDSHSLTDQQRYWGYVNCTFSVGVKSINARPVCKKLVQEVYGKHVVSRSCFYEAVDDPSDKCLHDTTSSYIKTVFCQTCSSDGCNGVSSVSPYAALILLTMSFVIKIIK